MTVMAVVRPFLRYSLTTVQKSNIALRRAIPPLQTPRRRTARLFMKRNVIEVGWRKAGRMSLDRLSRMSRSLLPSFLPARCQSTRVAKPLYSQTESPVPSASPASHKAIDKVLQGHTIKPQESSHTPPASKPVDRSKSRIGGVARLKTDDLDLSIGRRRRFAANGPPGAVKGQSILKKGNNIRELHQHSEDIWRDVGQRVEGVCSIFFIFTSLRLLAVRHI